MYNAELWVESHNLTARQLMEYIIMKTEPNTRICVCGSDNVSLHLAKDKSVMNIDCESLSELEEYEGKTPKKITEVLQ